MHDLSFKTGVKNIDVWREQDHFAGTAPGDSRMTNDVSCLPAMRVRGGRSGRAAPSVPIQKKRIWLASAALPTEDVPFPPWG